MQTAAKGVGGILYEVVVDALRFPAWWYTSGIVHTARSLVDVWRGYARMLAITVWMKNLFVPMYGQYNIQGRIISVFMRGVQIVFRGIALVVLAWVLVVLFVVYIALPVVAAAFVVYHATGGIFGFYG
ncbi:hypothetical protein HYS28_02130 [Candidatus Uhrbacteria bacterium]|nr:hypothetical protein [Candidatus Uhrbacteria bacterium]